MIRRLILIGLPLFSTVCAQVPDKSSSSGESAAVRRTWIIVSSLPEGIENPLKILAGEKLSEIRISSRNVGAEIDVPADGIIQVMRASGTEQDTPQGILVSVKVPQDLKESLVILMPDSSLNAPFIFKYHVIDLSQFRNSHALFVNLTKFEIEVVLAGRPTLIHPEKFEIVKTGEAGTKENVTISYKYRTSSDKEWDLISSSTIYSSNTTREILFFSYDAELSQIDYHGMSFNMIK